MKLPPLHCVVLLGPYLGPSWEEGLRPHSGLFPVCVLPEKQKLKATDYPLIARILQGPCEQVSKVFLMEKDQVEEVTYDVSHHGARWPSQRSDALVGSAAVAGWGGVGRGQHHLLAKDPAPLSAVLEDRLRAKPRRSC